MAFCQYPENSMACTCNSMGGTNGTWNCFMIGPPVDAGGGMDVRDAGPGGTDVRDSGFNNRDTGPDRRG
jgi:hypothetical protein